MVMDLNGNPNPNTNYVGKNPNYFPSDIHNRVEYCNVLKRLSVTKKYNVRKLLRPPYSKLIYSQKGGVGAHQTV